MAQVTNDYHIPSGICWDFDGDIGTGGFFSKSAYVSESNSILYITWQSPHYTFQAQGRRRRRLSPAKSLTVSPSGAIVWEPWGEWEGSDLSKDSSIRVTRPSGNSIYLGNQFVVPYDFSEYDLYEYQVRVRVLDEPSLTCSEWAYETLRVAFRPQWEYGSAMRNPDGSVTLEVLHNMPRACRFSLGTLEERRENGIYEKFGAFDQEHTIPTGGGTIVVPASAMGSHDKAETPVAMLASYDNVMVGGAGKGFAVGQVVEDKTITEPVVSIEEAASHIRVNVGDAGSENAHVSAEWTDAYGKRHVEELYVLDLREVGTLDCWRGIFEAPPYGVDVTYRVSVVGKSGWRTATVRKATNGKGVVSLTDTSDDACVELAYDPSWSSDSSIEGELVRCAGRSKPVARHGSGETTKVKASGTLLSNGDGAWLAEVQLLKGNRSWIYRNPLGERMKVMVDSVSVTCKHGSSIGLSISMTEVE